MGTVALARRRGGSLQLNLFIGALWALSLTSLGYLRSARAENPRPDIPQSADDLMMSPHFPAMLARIKEDLGLEVLDPLCFEEAPRILRGDDGRSIHTMSYTYNLNPCEIDGSQRSYKFRGIRVDPHHVSDQGMHAFDGAHLHAYGIVDDIQTERVYGFAPETGRVECKPWGWASQPAHSAPQRRISRRDARRGYLSIGLRQPDPSCVPSSPRLFRRADALGLLVGGLEFAGAVARGEGVDHLKSYLAISLPVASASAYAAMMSPTARVVLGKVGLAAEPVMWAINGAWEIGHVFLDEDGGHRYRQEKVISQLPYDAGGRLTFGSYMNACANSAGDPVGLVRAVWEIGYYGATFTFSRPNATNTGLPPMGPVYAERQRLRDGTCAVPFSGMNKWP